MYRYTIACLGTINAWVIYSPLGQQVGPIYATALAAATEAARLEAEDPTVPPRPRPIVGVWVSGEDWWTVAEAEDGRVPDDAQWVEIAADE